MIDRALLNLFGMRAALLITCVFVLIYAACVVGQAFSLSFVIVRLWEGATVSDVVAGIVVFFACFVLRQIVLTAQNAYLDRYARARATDLREDLLGAIYDLGNNGIHRHGSPALVSAVIEGIDDVETYISLMVPKFVSVIIIPLALVCVIFALDWVSGIITLVCFPFIILFMVLIGHTAQDDAAKRHGEFERMSNHFIDSLRGIETLKAFGKSRSWAARVYEASERFRELTLRTLRIATLSSTVLDLFATLGLAAVAIMLGFRMVDGSLAFFPALAVLIMVPEYFRPVRQFAADYHASLDGRTALAKVNRIIEEGQDAHAGQEGQAEQGAQEGQAAQAGRTAQDPDDRQLRSVDFSGKSQLSSFAVHSVFYSYDDVEGEYDATAASATSDASAVPDTPDNPDNPDTPGTPDTSDTLSDISFEVDAPCKIGIVGASGAGKSTLMNILAGFADPQSGSIALDGVDVSTLRDQSWHERSAFISQDPYIFRMSLRDNVALYCPKATDDEIMTALERAGLDGLLSELDQGLDTVIGDGARTLSGGQMQRVALARAFLDERRQVLFFDEPTAHLDRETEMEIRENMLPLMENKLVFFATHRLHWVADMDYLIELDGGRIVWQGSPREWPHAAQAQAQAQTTETMFTAKAVETVWVTPASATEATAASATAASSASATASTAAPSTTSPSAPSSYTAVRPRSFWRIWRNDTWVRPFFVRYGKVMVGALLLGLLAFIFSGALMFTSGYMISLAAVLPVTVLALHLPSLFVRIFGIGKPILGYLERLAGHDWVLRMTSNLRRKLYQAFERIVPTSSARMEMGRAHALLADDIGHVQDFYLRTVFPLVCAWLLCIIVVIAAGIFSLPLACAMLVLLAVEVVVVPLVSTCVNGARMLRSRETHAHLYDMLTDDVFGVQDWVLAGRRDDYLARHRGTSRRIHDLDAATKRANRIRDIVVQVVFGVCVVVLIIWAGEAFSAMAGTTQTGAVAMLSSVGGDLAPAYAPNWIAAFVLCFFPLIEAFVPASDAAMGLVTHSNAVQHLNDLPDPERENAKSADHHAGRYQKAQSPQGAPNGVPVSDVTQDIQGDAPVSNVLQDEQGIQSDAPVPDIVFENVSFRYEDGIYDVLHDFNLTIPGGQKVALLGRSGVGKTTLALLLRGEITPSAGHVLIGGVDAADLSEAADAAGATDTTNVAMQHESLTSSISQQVCIIEQHPHIFNETLRENLLIGCDEADNPTDAELCAILKAVGLEGLLNRLPQGLNTMVDESGRCFSGGERHRVALARVLLSHAPIVIFDEPFTGLDPKTEEALLNTILDTLADRTVIIIIPSLR